MSKFIRKERKRERLQQCEKKGRVVVVNLSALVIIFPLAGELIKEALHKNYEVIHSIKALHLDCYVYLH